MTWNKRLYFPSEGRRAEDFFALKNPTASVGCEPANLGTKGQHATSKPPKHNVHLFKCLIRHYALKAYVDVEFSSKTFFFCFGS